jgi:hypothetical protein
MNVLLNSLVTNSIGVNELFEITIFHPFELTNVINHNVLPIIPNLGKLCFNLSKQLVQLFFRDNLFR